MEPVVDSKGIKVVLHSDRSCNEKRDYILEYCLREGFNESVCKEITLLANNNKVKFETSKQKINLYKTLFEMLGFSTEDFILFINNNKYVILERNIKEIYINFKTNLAILSFFGIEIKPNLLAKYGSLYMTRTPDETFAVIKEMFEAEVRECESAAKNKRLPRKKFLITHEKIDHVLIRLTKQELKDKTSKYPFSARQQILMNLRFEVECKSKGDKIEGDSYKIQRNGIGE